VLSNEEASGAAAAQGTRQDRLRFEAVRRAIDALNASPADLGFEVARMNAVDGGVFAVGRAALGDAEARNGGGMPLALLFRFEGVRIIDISAPASSVRTLDDGSNDNGHEPERGRQ